MLASNFTIAQQFADASCKYTFQHLPAEIIDLSKLRVLDLLAAYCASVDAGCHANLLNIFEDEGDTIVWGTSCRRSLRDAIVVNSSVSHATYFEDGSRFTGGHPSSALIPAVLTIAGCRRIPGSTLLAAIANGYEAFLRLGQCLYPAIVKRGFQSTAILAAPATAVASAHLLGLSREHTAHAIAIACSQGAGLKDALRSASSQPMQVGRSSEGGYLSTLLAAEGATGYLRIIEEGFARAFSGDTHAAIAAGWGKDWKIVETYLKKHGGCRGNHAAIDVVALLLEKERIDVSAIDGIDIHVDSVTYAAAIEPPENPEEAKFSIAFSVAAMLLKGDVFPNRFSNDVLHEPLVQSLMQRIKVSASASLDEDYPRFRPATAAIRLKDGRQLTHRVDYANGEPEAPLSAAQVIEKFETAASPLFGAGTKKIKERVFKLETLEDTSMLTALLAV